jgi:DNA-binding CsgD family transcriptional regulator
MERLSIDVRETALVADVMETCRASQEWPVPYRALDQLAELLHADVVGFQVMDTLLEYIPLHRVSDAAVGDGEDGETVVEARTNPFWRGYWTSPCSYPDRSGDYESVTLAGDFHSRRERRLRKPGGAAIVSMRACLPGRSPGRHYRVVAWRCEGADFGERERFLLSLLRPHVERALWSNAQQARELPALTRRQLQLLALVQRGLTNRQIARHLELSEGTVRTHLNNIYERLGTSGRTAAVHAVFGPSEHWPLEA